MNSDDTLTAAPRRISLHHLNLLAECEIWVRRRPDCDRFPYALVLYVPAHMAHLAAPLLGSTSEPRPQRDLPSHLTLVD